MAATYDSVRAAFEWHLPPDFNMGTACADRHPASNPAVIDLGDDSAARTYNFGQVAELSNRLGNALRSCGVEAGDRVAVLLPQSIETALSHLAIYKIGAIAVPLSVLFGPDAL